MGRCASVGPAVFLALSARHRRTGDPCLGIAKAYQRAMGRWAWFKRIGEDLSLIFNGSR